MHFMLCATKCDGNKRESVRMRESRTDEAIQGKSFSENKDQDHSHKQLRLLRVGPARDINTEAAIKFRV